MKSLTEAKHTCALRGGIVLPFKSKGIYSFMRKYLSMVQSRNVYVGLNMTSKINLFTDGSLYSSQSYDYDGEGSKLDGHDCAYLKEGIWFKPRGSSCVEKYEFMCLWTRKFFIETYMIVKHELQYVRYFKSYLYNYLF